MLNTIDTVIAFAVIMTVQRLLITIVEKMVSVTFSLWGTAKDSTGRDVSGGTSTWDNRATT